MKAILETTMGTITLALDEEKAPETVKNFAQYAKDGHYDGTIFHRVIDGFMIQGGGFTKDMNQKETREPIRNEAMNIYIRRIFKMKTGMHEILSIKF